MLNPSIYEKLLKFQNYFSFLGKDFVKTVISDVEKMNLSSDQECYKTASKLLKKYIKEEINKQYQNNQNEFFSNLMNGLFKKEAFEDLEKIKVLSTVIKSIDSCIPTEVYDFLANKQALKSVLDNIFNDEADYDKLYTDYKELKDIFNRHFNLYDTKDEIDSEEQDDSLLNYEEVKELYRKMASGDKSAKDILITKNLRLVQKIASWFLTHYNITSFTYDDLCQEGTIGLMKAIEKYDPNKGYKFSTYSCHWIKQNIRIALANGDKTIRVPVHLAEKNKKINKMIFDLEAKLKRPPTKEEIKRSLNISDDDLRHYYESLIYLESINRKVGENEDTELGELIKDEDAFGELSDDKLNKGTFIKFLKDNLSDQEFDVMMNRLGLASDGEHSTFQVIGQKYNVSRERIRQLQKKAISKIFLNPTFVEYLIEDDNLLEFARLKKVCSGILLGYIAYRTGLVGSEIKTPIELEGYIKKEILETLEEKTGKILRENDDLVDLYIRYCKFYGINQDEILAPLKKRQAFYRKKIERTTGFDCDFSKESKELFSGDLPDFDSSAKVETDTSSLESLISMRTYLVQIRDDLSSLVPLINDENYKTMLEEAKLLTEKILRK